MTGSFRQYTACVVVYEKQPYWGPELQRELLDLNILVRECRSVSDLLPAAEETRASIVLIDVDASPSECLVWLNRIHSESLSFSVIACASSRLRNLEWTMREAGVTEFCHAESTGIEMARRIKRILGTKAT